MSERAYGLSRIIVTIAVAVVVGVSVAAGNVIAPVIAVSVGIGVLLLLKRRVTVVVEDERDFLVSEKASRSALSVFGPIVSVATPLLIVLGQQGDPALSAAGVALGIGASVLVLLYLAFYRYYNRRYGFERHAE